MAQTTSPLIRTSDEIQYDTVDAATGLSKGVLIGGEHGAPHFAIRRFVLDAGAEVPKHTNAVEHVQYVLDGHYTVGIDGEEFTVSPGDSLLIPANTVHWYRNTSDEPGAFLCAVPHGDDEIKLQD